MPKKKIFCGNKEKKSKGGSDLYRYDHVNDVEFNAVETKYAEEIDAHFARLYPERETSVFHEIVSDTVHIDLNIMAPTKEEPFYVVYTTGMSALPMHLPEELEKDYSHLKYGELQLHLPEEWLVGNEAFKDNKNYWPFRLLKELARFPHKYNSYLGYGHTIPNSADYIPYAENTDLSGVILALFGEDESCTVTTSDDETIMLYSVIPLYKEEMDYKLEAGMDALFYELEDLQFNLQLVIPNRPKAI